MDSMNTCPSCGATLNPNAKFCVKCGTAINTSAAPTPAPQAAAPVPPTPAPQATAPVPPTPAPQPAPQPQQGGYNPFNGQQPQQGPSFGEQFSNFTDSVFAKTSKKCNQLVRRYFLGFGDIRFISLVLAILSKAIWNESALGTFLAVIFGIIFLFFCFFSIYMVFTGSGKVDEATRQATDFMKKRAMEKFYMDEDQMKLIEPIVVIGPGVPPVGLKNGSVVNYARGTRFFNIFSLIGRHLTKDPIEAYRVGFDDVLRYLLLQVTVYAFADDQMMVYAGNVDVSTGMVYEESTAEIFYNDINSIKRAEVLKKRWSWRRFRHLYYTMQGLEVDVQGIMNIGAIDMRFTSDDVNRSIVGMENLVRERKMQ